MIQAKFYKKNGKFSGFRVSGHAGYADAGEDIVCAAVSSAVQLTVNLLSDFGCNPDISSENNVVKCNVKRIEFAESKIFRQLKLHIESISEEFPNTIKITVLEV